MEEIIPLFKSHYSIGRSILTLNKEKDSENGSDSILDICVKNKLKSFYLVEDGMSGFLEAYRNSQELDLFMIYGLRITLCGSGNTIKDRNDAAKKNCSKCIIFSKSTEGYQKILKIYSEASTKGFYYEPRVDMSLLNEYWDDNDLLLAIPFYDSFIHKNRLTFDCVTHDFSKIKPVLLSEDNDHPIDSIIQKGVDIFSKEENLEVVKAKSIYYNLKKDFKHYLAFRCINKRTRLSKPNLEFMCSEEFSFESWAEQNNIKIYKQKKTKSQNAKINETNTVKDINDEKISTRRFSTGIIEFNIPQNVIKEAKVRGEKLGSIKNSIEGGGGNIAGYTGQIMFQKIFGGIDTDTESNNAKFSYDIFLKGEGWEVKTKKTSKNEPMELYYDASIASITKQQKFDKVAFFRVNLQTRKGWFGGYATYDQWMKNRFPAHTGQKDDSNGFQERCNCHKMTYGSLLKLPNPKLEIIN